MKMKTAMVRSVGCRAAQRCLVRQRASQSHMCHSRMHKCHYSASPQCLEVPKRATSSSMVHNLANDQYNLTMPLRGSVNICLHIIIFLSHSWPMIISDPNIHWCVLNDIRRRILEKPYDTGATPKNARAIRNAFAEMEAY